MIVDVVQLKNPLKYDVSPFSDFGGSWGVGSAVGSDHEDENRSGSHIIQAAYHQVDAGRLLPGREETDVWRNKLDTG